MLGTDPTSALVCVLGEPALKTARAGRLRADAATSLARLIASSPRMADPPAQCTVGGSGPATLILFRYSDGTIAYVAGRLPICHVLTIGRDVVDVARPVTDFVSRTTRGLFGGSRPAPDLMGLSLAEARVTAQRAGLELDRGGVVVDPDVPNATVALANPRTDSRRIGVVIAVRTAPRCAGRQLAIQYLPGGAGFGHDFGTVAFRNVSATWCEFAGPARVSGVATTGRAVTRTVSASAAPHVELSPRTAPLPPHTNPAPDSFLAELVLSAAYRDDPKAAGGLCAPHWVVPAAWRVALPGRTFVVANGPAPRGAPQIGDSGLVTCRGEFGAGRIEQASAG